MALAPSPTTTVDGVDLHATPSYSGQPRNAWMAFDTRPGQNYAYEMFAGETRAAVKRNCWGGLSDLLVIERDAHQWRSVRHRDLPFYKHEDVIYR